MGLSRPGGPCAMKTLTFLIWLSWASIAGRVLLAPTFKVTLTEGLVLLLVCAPAVGLLCWLRWVLKPSAKAGKPSAEETEALPPRPVPSPKPPRIPVQVF